jgi:hypothetical protein
MANYLGVNTDELAGVPTSTVVNGSSASVVTITVGASPFSYVAPAYGTVNVSGGTVSQVAVKRGSVTTNLGGIVGHFLQSKGDTLVVTYSVLPAMVFIAN